MNFWITMQPKRRTRVTVGRDGSVGIHQQVEDARGEWIGRDVILNQDEWDRAVAVRIGHLARCIEEDSRAYGP